jgi:hypothetical protein
MAHPEVETVARGEATMILLGETEAGSAETQPCRGIAWLSYRCLENPARGAKYALTESAFSPF